MTNKELTNYVTLNNIMKEKNPEKKKHAMDTFYIMKSMERQREENRKKQPNGR